MEESKSTHGGKRPGSGKPKKAETTTLNFRITVEKKKQLKEKYGAQLNTMFKDWIEAL